MIFCLDTCQNLPFVFAQPPNPQDRASENAVWLPSVVAPAAQQGLDFRYRGYFWVDTSHDHEY